MMHNLFVSNVFVYILASSKHVKADNPSPTLKRPLPTDASTLQPPVKKKTQGTKAAEPNELGGKFLIYDIKGTPPRSVKLNT
jgi:hypothetical protein